MAWGQALRNLGQLAGYGARSVGAAARGKYGSTAAGAIWGAGAGAGYGALSNDTSMIGGALMGAGMGAAGGRYGASGLRRARLGKRGIGVSGLGTRGAAQGFARGVRNKAMMDFRGARLAGNQAISRVGSTIKGWGLGR